MPRSRILKPQFFVDEDVADLQPLTRIFFMGLWCYADREGRFELKYRTLKMNIMPYDECDVSVMVIELEERGMIVTYKVNGREFGQIRSFKKHQNPHPKEAASVIPPNPADPTQLQLPVSNQPTLFATVEVESHKSLPDNGHVIKRLEHGPSVELHGRAATFPGSSVSSSNSNSSPTPSPTEPKKDGGGFLISEKLKNYPKFAEAWAEFLEYNDGLKFPYQQKSLQALLNQFDDWGPRASAVALCMTILGGGKEIKRPSNQDVANLAQPPPQDESQKEKQAEYVRVVREVQSRGKVP